MLTVESAINEISKYLGDDFRGNETVLLEHFRNKKVDSVLEIGVSKLQHDEYMNMCQLPPPKGDGLRKSDTNRPGELNG